MRASLNSLHQQINDWIRVAEFYKTEFGILQSRLEEIASKNTGAEVMAQVEHFQNKFLIVKQHLEILDHDLRKELDFIAEKTKEIPGHTNEKIVEEYSSIKKRVKDTISDFTDLRFEFNMFLSKIL